jgi:UDP-3-O-[3-hydroxymyristoyl] glucosamine N-acyltransferase
VIGGLAIESQRGGESELVLTAADIAEAVRGELRGDPDAAVGGVAPLDRACERDLSFLATARYAALFAESRAGIVLVAPDLCDAPGSPKARVIVKKPHDAMLSLLPRFYKEHRLVPGVHATAVVGRGVQLGRDVVVGPYAVLGDNARIGDGAVIDSHVSVGRGVTIGAQSRLFPSVTVYAGSEIGARVIIHAGARIGSDGFGYVQRDGGHHKIPHVGRCIIQDDVEIGANTTIDRGSVDDTVIGAGTKVDNLVHIGHNCRVGKLCLIMAQVGLSGSGHLEDGCIIAGQAGLQGHITVGRGARIGGQSGVFGDVPPGETWSGYPARPHRESLRASAAMFKLPGLMRKLEQLLQHGTSDK